MDMRLIVAGSRSFSDYALLSDEITNQVEAMECLTRGTLSIVSGTARGADALGERWASELGVPIHRFPADWNRYGRRAGYLRNVEMAKFATDALIFWDGVSPGSKHMIDICAEFDLPHRVVKYVPEGAPVV